MRGDDAQIAEARRNQWAHLVSDVRDKGAAPVKINQV
jgi:hypothetical protein